MSGRLLEPSGRTAAVLLIAGCLALAASGVALHSAGRLPPGPAVGPELAARLAAVRRATPAAAEKVATAAAAARANLETGDQFTRRLRDWSPVWRAECRAREPRFGLDVRRYRLTCTDPSARAWTASLDLLRALAGVPGITIEQLAITASPSGTGAFTQLAVELTVRLRP